jgi:tRNA dimethylallyltransferase
LDPVTLPRAIAILGPTGSGKSALAMRLAAALPVELISVDSAQVYRGLDIGTAKPTIAERAAVPHHLIDIRDLDQVYSAGEFRNDCLVKVAEISARGRLPVLVGGTMLYFRSLFRGIADMPGADLAIRAQIEAQAALRGWPALHAELAMQDPHSAARIHPQDSQRIQRALEVLRISGSNLAEHWAQPTQVESFANWQIFLLEPSDRAQLHQRLAARLQLMLEAGFAAEVRQLQQRPELNENSPALRLVGYRQLLAYCKGEESLQRASERALFATRQLAKRQLTWLRSDSLLPSAGVVHRIDPFSVNSVEQMLQVLIESH